MRTGRYKFVTSAPLFFEEDLTGMCVSYAHETRIARKKLPYTKLFFWRGFDLRTYYA